MDVTGISPITEFDLCYILKGVTMKMIKKKKSSVSPVPTYVFLS